MAGARSQGPEGAAPDSPGAGGQGSSAGGRSYSLQSCQISDQEKPLSAQSSEARDGLGEKAGRALRTLPTAPQNSQGVFRWQFQEYLPEK